MKSKLIFNSLSFIGKSLSTTKYIVLIVFLLLVTISCEEEESATNQCDAQIEQLTDILVEKSTAFGTNSTVSNCQAYRTAYLNLYNKMTQCGYPTSSLDSDYEFVQNLDCSTFDGGTGGGGTGGGGGGTSTGNAMIWSQVDHGCGNISVTVNGSTQILSAYYSSGAPSCGASGSANFTLNPGTYSVTASCSGLSWNGTVTVSAGGCSRLKLN
jgi:hypothetical protein